MRRIGALLLMLLLVFTLSACKEESYTNIDNEQLKTFLSTPDDYQFVDVRTAGEYYDSHVVGFTYNIDYYLLDEANGYSEFDVLDKTKPVVLMCRSGNRSSLTAEILVELGFEEVYNLENGINEWDGETE